MNPDDPEEVRRRRLARLNASPPSTGGEQPPPVTSPPPSARASPPPSARVASPKRACGLELGPEAPGPDFSRRVADNYQKDDPRRPGLATRVAVQHC